MKSNQLKQPITDRQQLLGSNGGPGTEEDMKMMSDPLRWPRWPWLPLKRVTKNLEAGQWDQFGLLYADLPIKVQVHEFTRNGSKVREVIEYEDFFSVIQDGWHVD